MHLRRYHRRLHRRLFLSGRAWRQRLVFWGGAIAIGLVSVAFATASDGSRAIFDAAAGMGWWVPLVLTPIGFALSAHLARTVFPGSQGSGIQQAIAALAKRDDAGRRALLSIRIAIGKIVLTLVGLACGASIGREGPTVQVGASLMLAAGSILVPSLLASTNSRWFTEIIQQWMFESQDWNTGSAYAFLLLLLCTFLVTAVMRIFRVSLSDIAK